MKLFKRVSKAFNVLAGRSVQEAAGAVNDNDETGWRRLSATKDRSLSYVNQERQQELAVWLWKTNPLARFMIEIQVAYLLAEGVTPAVEDEEARAWINEFWDDPITRMDQTLIQKVRELSLFGEQCWPVFRDQMTGHIRLGTLDPGLIATVIRDPDNVAMVVGIKTRGDKGIEERFYRVIVPGPETIFSPATQNLRASFQDGECFYFAVNALTGERGTSDLLAVMDWLDLYDKALFEEIERWGSLRAFLWDITLKGATEEVVQKRASEIMVPDGGGFSVHNDSETWTPLTPDLQATSGSDFARLFRNHIMGGAGLPEHWFGGGGDVNLATAGAMGEPTYKIMTMRQTDVRHMIETVVRYAVRSRLMALGLLDLAADPAYLVSVTMPEMTAKDTTAYAGAFAQVATALTMAIDRGLFSDETAIELLAAVAARIGVEIDPGEELKKAREDAAARPARDVPPGFDEMPL